jgi:hypothetical protein
MCPLRQSNLAIVGSSIFRIGRIEPLEIEYGDRTFAHSFEIMDLHSGPRCIFGLNILSKAGIFMSGVPVCFSKKVTRQKRADILVNMPNGLEGT